MKNKLIVEVTSGRPVKIRETMKNKLIVGATGGRPFKQQEENEKNEHPN